MYFCFFLTGLGHDKFVLKAMEDSGIDEHHTLHGLSKSLCSRLLESRSVNTNKKYFYSYLKWEKFANEHNLVSMPASPIHVTLYLVNLLDSGATWLHVVLLIRSCML